MIGWEAGVSDLASCCFFFAAGSWVCSDGFPPERLSWVLLCLLFFLPLRSVLFSLLEFSFFAEVRLVVFVPLVGDARFGLSLFASCSCLLLLLMSWGGFFCVGGYACCGVCVFSSASPCCKESLRGAPLCMHCLLLLLFVPSSCFLSICLFLSCLFLFLMHAHAWRRRTLGLSLMSSYDAALVTQALRPAYCSPSVLLPHLFVLMADAAQAAPRHQRRKEARAQADEDVRRVRQRMDDADVRLDTLEGRLRGHDLRLQYLEAPLKLVLKKFKAPVEFWAAKDNGFQAAKSAFSAAFIQELRDAGGVTVQHLLEEAEPILAELDSHVVIGIFRTGGATQDKDGNIIPDAVLRLQPGDQGLRLGYLLSSIGRHLGEDRVVHTDRPRKHQGEKGKGKGKGKAQGKGKDKGLAQPKRAAGRGA